MTQRWFIRRVIASVWVLAAALFINFIIPRLMPGNPIWILTGGRALTPEVRQALIDRFGLEEPVWEQFWHYLAGIFQGDLGLSFAYFPTPVWTVVMNALPWTLLIIWTSIILEAIIGYSLGAIAAWKVGTKVDSSIQASSLIVVSTPLFWIGMVILFIFGFQLGWFPLGGCVTPGATYSNPLGYAADIMRHAALPIMAYTVGRYGMYQLVMRNTMVTTLREQYILTAEAKGLSESKVKHRHAARNSLLPMITMLGVGLSVTIGEAVFIETIFSYPGIGKLLWDSVLCRDHPVLYGTFFMFALLVITFNFLVDIFYMYLDPRIRY